MKPLAQQLLTDLKNAGATYAEIRFHLSDRAESISILDGNVQNYSTSELFGYGVRVLFQGAWGFASNENKSELNETGKRALENAKASSKFIKRAITLAPKPVAKAHYESPCKINPFTVPLKDKIRDLLQIESLMKHPRFDHTSVSVLFHEREILFLDSDGAEITKKLIDVRGDLNIMAKDKDGLSQERNFNLYLDANGTRGYESIIAPEFNQGERIKNELLEILDAPLCEKGVMDVILLPEMMALQVHETIGHALELDRILGYELSYAGGSHVSFDSFDTLQFGSQKLTARADATVKNSPGSVGFDDDGMPAQNVVLIDKGVLRSAISGRQSVSEANEKAGREIFKSSGSASRATDYSKPPIDRMNNINVDFGSDGTLEDFIKDTENGIIMESPRSWSIGSNRENFHFACEYGMRIKNGKLAGLVRNATYRGDSVKFWNTLDKVGNESTWQLQQVFNCGKGQPNQQMRLGHGVPLARFKNIEVGY